mmetsp:Transcript_15647/g.25595  ORF Transcript_15647/g.25595 Transcript_15647/m.25595 type:complete len:119 (-) Transcript_15647:1498-1854(-)
MFAIIRNWKVPGQYHVLFAIVSLEKGHGTRFIAPVHVDGVNIGVCSNLKSRHFALDAVVRAVKGLVVAPGLGLHEAVDAQLFTGWERFGKQYTCIVITAKVVGVVSKFDEQPGIQGSN